MSPLKLAESMAEENKDVVWAAAQQAMEPDLYIDENGAPRSNT